MKRHLAVLDGLRGTASLLVVIFHLQEAYFEKYALNPLRHAHLAVDFFFMLSGYVVGYAYDDRLANFSVRDFLRVRFIRLHPLVLLSALLGVLCYWYAPYAGQLRGVGLGRVVGYAISGALLLPFVSQLRPQGLVFPLNAPCWSLLQEYLANVAYILLAPRLGRRALQAVVALSAVAVVAAALKHGSLQGGYSWDSFWMGPVRVAFPFGMGLLLFRQRISLRVPGAFWVLSGVLLAVFAGPAFQPAALYEAFCVIVVFPLVLAAGAGAGRVAGLTQAACQLGGRLSYPLYLVHYPFVVLFTYWVQVNHPALRQAVLIMGGLVVFFLLLAWVALRFYDEPLRARLGAYLRRPAPPVLLPVEA